MADELARILAGVDTPSPKRQAEARPYQFSLHDRAMHLLTDKIFGEYATPRDLEAVKRYTNAAIAAWPGVGPILNRIPKDYFVPGIAALGAVRPALEAIMPMIAEKAVPRAGAEFTEAIMDVADPWRQYEPTDRFSANAIRPGPEAGAYTREQWETSMYGQEGEAEHQTAMVPGPRSHTPPNISLEKIEEERRRREEQLKSYSDRSDQWLASAKASPSTAAVIYGDEWPWNVDQFGGRKKNRGIPPLPDAPY